MPVEARIGQLLVDDRVEAEIEAQAAIFRRHGRAEQPRLARRQPEGAVDDPLLLPAVLMRRDLLADEFADGLPKELVFLLIGGPALKLKHGKLLDG